MHGPTWEPIVNAEQRRLKLKEQIDQFHHTEEEKLKIIDEAANCLRAVMEDFSEPENIPRYQRDILARSLQEIVELMNFAEQNWRRSPSPRHSLSNNFFSHQLRAISNAAVSHIRKILDQN